MSLITEPVPLSQVPVGAAFHYDDDRERKPFMRVSDDYIWSPESGHHFITVPGIYEEDPLCLIKPKELCPALDHKWPIVLRHDDVPSHILTLEQVSPYHYHIKAYEVEETTVNNIPTRKVLRVIAFINWEWVDVKIEDSTLRFYYEHQWTGLQQVLAIMQKHALELQDQIQDRIPTITFGVMPTE